MNITRLVTVPISLLFACHAIVFAQKERPAPVCSQATMAAHKDLPELEYDCPIDLIESDDRILKLPARLEALNYLMKELAGFDSPRWWQARVDDLSAREFHKVVGDFSEEHIEAWKRGDYPFSLFGNQQIRLVLVEDPCYQPGFNGSNAFLLYRKQGKVFVTQVLNGYYSRADNSVGIAFARLNGEQVIEVSTGNSMPPSLTYYYFAIDPKTKQAVPKKLFKENGKLTNQIWSAMLIGDTKSAPELKIIRRQRLNRTFSAYRESDHGKIDDNGRRLRRIVYRWNGRFYSSN